MEKVYSEKGKSLIIYQNYTYRFLKDIKSTAEQCWRCSRGKNCNAKLYTLDDGSVFSRVASDHNHESIEERLINRATVSNAVKRNIEDVVGEKPARKVRKMVEDLKKPLETLTRQDMICIRNNLSRAKVQNMPKLPKTIEEVQTTLEHVSTITTKGEEFLLVNDQNDNIVIFSCEENLKFLSKSKILLMDGTFENAPKYFLQVFTIHGFCNGVYVPLVFCLLKDKKKQTYTNAIKNVHEECFKRKLQLQPQSIVVDFEQAIHECVKIMFPQSKIVGCRFHLGQSWWRKIQNLGLSTLYMDKGSEEGRWLHYCFGLSYLKPENVEEAFCQLVATQPANPQLTKFADYLCVTYIDEEMQATFPPRIWAEETADLWRTTNACESFHSRFNAMFSSTHPNIFVFLKNLLSCQTDSYILLNTVSKSYHRVSKQTKKRQEFVLSKITQLRSGEIDILVFVQSILNIAAVL